MALNPLGRLATDDDVRHAQIVEHARPTILRPLLPEDQEAALATVEANTSKCYSTLEELTYRWRRIAIQLRAGRITVRATVPVR